MPSTSKTSPTRVCFCVFQAKSTHGLFLWTWSDGAGVDWSLKDADGARLGTLLAAGARAREAAARGGGGAASLVAGYEDDVQSLSEFAGEVGEGT